MPGFDDEEPEVEIVYLDDVRPRDIYGNVIVPSEWSGADDDFDGEALIDNILSGDTE